MQTITPTGLHVTKVNSRRFDVRTTPHQLLDLGRRTDGTANANNDKRLAARVKQDMKSFLGMRRTDALALNGWPEGLALAERYRRELPRLQATGIVRRRVWAEDGDEFDRDRFDSGREDCWSARKRASGCCNKPILRLTAAIGGTADITASDLAWTGAAAFAVCDAAEAAGYQLEIDAISTAENVSDSGHSVAVIVRVKDAGDALDRNTAIMALACPAFFRWHVMNARLFASPEVAVDDGFGWTTDTHPDLIGELHIGRCYSAEAAECEVGRLIGRINTLAAA